MALMMATIFSFRSPMCMLPSLPRVSPPTRPMYWAKTWRGCDAADEIQRQVAVAGEQDVVRVRRPGRRPTADRLLPAADVDAADDLALAVELPLDAVFDLPHQEHVAMKLARKAGLGVGRLARRGVVGQKDGLHSGHVSPQ